MSLDPEFPCAAGESLPISLYDHWTYMSCLHGCVPLQGTNFSLKVSGIMVADPTAEQLSVHRAALAPDSAYVFETRHGSGVKVIGQRSVMTTQLFKHKEFNFEMLGIGGLDDQFEQIFRRAFASRVFPPSVVERLGIRHVRGVLLYGPPGGSQFSVEETYKNIGQQGKSDCLKPVEAAVQPCNM
jgi:hypothetical protein